MPMRRRKSKSHREPTIALINVVFLMLVFFMVAGSLAPSMDPSVRLVKASDLEASPPPDALVIRADGSLSFRGAELTSPEAYVRIIWEEEEEFTARLVPDRALPAASLLAVAKELRRLGAVRITLLSERNLS
ncbi:ExbD/TolR family protein [Tritonibacter mobilis]|uniref:ExbD/TolR family protein n=1 Tax=Tritonibacter mobilis TaxID=379347 RepID=UPI0009BD5B8C|nr:biopolymer transporter ExbD [Tritonibacter mobilis]NHM19915.1 biopolymer transporter ExbD [Tritonibacter mobilis]NHM24096.1 biopolymer transporter ExbD [Tritonibacter mobilis]